MLNELKKMRKSEILREENQTSSEKLLPDSIYSRLINCLANLKNPHPKLSWKTWGLIILLVVTGVIVYTPFFAKLTANASQFVTIN